MYIARVPRLDFWGGKAPHVNFWGGDWPTLPPCAAATVAAFTSSVVNFFNIFLSRIASHTLVFSEGVACETNFYQANSVKCQLSRSTYYRAAV